MSDKQTAGLFSALLIDVRPLQECRDFRLLFIGQFVSSFGSAISFVVLPWQMYQLTKSSVAVGMVGVVEFIAMFVAGGALADFIDRRRLIGAGNLLRNIGSQCTHASAASVGALCNSRTFFGTERHSSSGA